MLWFGVGSRGIGIAERTPPGSIPSSPSRYPYHERKAIDGSGSRIDGSGAKRRRSVVAVTQDARDEESPRTSARQEVEIRSRLHEVDDAMSFLKSVPNEQAEEVLKFIKASSDPIAALCSLHRGIQGIQRSPALSNYKTTRATFPQASQLAYELSLSHPTSYPILVPVEQIFVPVDSFPEFEAIQSPSSVFTSPAAAGSSGRGENYLPVNSVRSPAAFYAGSAQTSPPSFGPLPPATLVDRRLYSLKIREWTEVPISDELAAKMLSLYLETDHAILGWFDAELLITALCGGFKSGFCSPFLVSSLFYWISKAYNAIDDQSVILGRQFLEEAKARWQSVQREDSMLTVAGCMILSIGLASDGEDGLSYMFKNEGVAMGERLRLFNVTKSASEISLDESMSANIYRARAHIAWGCYNWIVLHSSFYLEQPLAHPPSFYIPENSLPYMGNTFAAVCRFRVIYAEVLTVYNAKDNGPFVANSITLYFAERKYHELLEWADSLDTYTQRWRNGTPHHVMVLHIWYHTAVLDIFGPFITQYLILQTFAANSTPEAISEASLMQLKCLVVEYWQWQPSALYTLMWHPSLLYIGNAVLSSPSNNNDWRFYFDICVEAYIHLYPCYHITAGFLQGLMFIALKNGLLSTMEARDILNRLFSKGIQLQAPSHIVDFGKALMDKFPEQIETLAKRIEGLVTGRAQIEEETE